VRQYNNAARIGRHLVQQGRVDAPPHLPVLLVLGGGEGVAEPFDQRPALVVDERQEAPRHGVVLRVDAALDHDRRGAPPGEHRRDAVVGAHAVSGLAGVEHPAANGVGALVMRADGDLHARRQPQLRRHMGRDRPDHRGRGNRPRQPVRLQTGGGQQLVRPGFSVDIEKQRAVGYRVVNGRLRPQHEGHKARPVEEVGRPLVKLRLVILDPA